MEMQGKDNDEVIVTDQKFEDHFLRQDTFFISGEGWGLQHPKTLKNIGPRR